MDTVKILGRLRSKHGGTLETFNADAIIASNIPDRWEFISKVPNMPSNIITRYAMLYNTKEQ